MGRRKKFNRLPEAKQLAKQLLLHRVWNGKSQSNIADVLEVTFQQYQKIERCENRLMAEQLLKICKTFDWDPAIIMLADPVATLNEWEQNKPRHQKAGIDSAINRIHKKFYAIDVNAASRYYNERN
jgi:transcriptional regulator with XRE-family HTH domain|tara:strand:+ start:295 stop:672 length:378 start_codon:yes stop_codon:yes gene_type:complete